MFFRFDSRILFGIDGVAINAVELDWVTESDIEYVEATLDQLWVPKQPRRLREFVGGRICAGRCLQDLSHSQTINGDGDGSVAGVRGSVAGGCRGDDGEGGGRRGSGGRGGDRCGDIAKRRQRVVSLPIVDRSADGRSPKWPQYITGSITHNRRLACAVASTTTEHICTSIGVDIVTPSRISEKLWNRITSEDERESLRASSGISERVFAVTFSAKEAFYKANYQLDARYLAFSALKLRSVTVTSPTETTAPTRLEPNVICSYGLTTVDLGDDHRLSDHISRLTIRWAQLGGGEIITAALIA